MVVIESLFMVALLSAFIGIIALLVMARPEAQQSREANRTLGRVVVGATAVAVLSFLIYAVSPHEEVRQTAYGGSETGRTLH
jgi:ABC-type Fe3+-siderophore transport system permease subunit